jgi:hypothetical protein
MVESLWHENLEHDVIAVIDNKAYLTNWFKSVLHVLDTLLNLSGKIMSILC